MLLQPTLTPIEKEHQPKSILNALMRMGFSWHSIWLWGVGICLCYSEKQTSDFKGKIPEETEWRVLAQSMEAKVVRYFLPPSLAASTGTGLWPDRSDNPATLNLEQVVQRCEGPQRFFMALMEWRILWCADDRSVVMSSTAPLPKWTPLLECSQPCCGCSSVFPLLDCGHLYC